VWPADCEAQIDDTLSRKEEEMSDKAWVITSGSYSDYHINHVYRTKKAAQAWIDNRTDSYNYDLNDWDYQDDEPLSERFEILHLAYTDAECEWSDLEGYAHRLFMGRGKGKPSIGGIMQRTTKFTADQKYEMKAYPNGVPGCEVNHGYHNDVLVAVVVFGTDRKKVWKVMKDKAAQVKAFSYLAERAKE
jgi:hypothetical protein